MFVFSCGAGVPIWLFLGVNIPIWLVFVMTSLVVVDWQITWSQLVKMTIFEVVERKLQYKPANYFSLAQLSFQEKRWPFLLLYLVPHIS